jgi:hypothetical protein
LRSIGRIPFFASDCDFDGALRRIDWRNFEYSDRLVLIAVSVPPRVCTSCLAMTDKIENFNLPFPSSLILEKFFHTNGFDVERFATMRRSNGVFEFRNLSRWHSSISLSPMCSHLIKSGICGMKFSKICALTGCSDPMDAASILSAMRFHSVGCGTNKSRMQSSTRSFTADHTMP